jgi:autotransporter-associated beta strand protein
MKCYQATPKSGVIPYLVLGSILLSATLARAGSATWVSNPINGNWNTASNWSPQTVPNGPFDTATFTTSSNPNLTLSAPIEISAAFFQPGASKFNISLPAAPSAPSLTLSGAGVINDSGATQSFVAQWGADFGSPTINFNDTASAGTNTTYTAQGGTVPNTTGGLIQFFDSSTAEEGTFVSGAALSPGVSSGTLGFYDDSTAGAATISASGGTASGAVGGLIGFHDDSTAGTATLIANGGANGGLGGVIHFFDTTTGGTPRIVVMGNGSLDFSGHDPNVPVSIGTIEGTGTISLATSIIVGANNHSCNFSGPVTGTGALTKVGRGRLTLTKANGYSGGTTINGGSLLANNRSGSATGVGRVRVNRGVLGGNGQIVVGPVTLASTRASLEPGGAKNTVGALTLVCPLTFLTDSSYNVDLDTVAATADKVIAQGVTLGNSARINVLAMGSSTIASGTVFTLIDNTAPTPISGSFANLPDGSLLTVGSNTLKASYSGGDGNDLTLTEL